MQKVTILCVGKLKEKFYADAVAEYAKRLSRSCKLEIVELPEERLPEDPSPALIDAALARQDGRICAVDLAKNFGQHAAIMAGLNHTRGNYVVCLDDDGQTPADEVDKLLEKLGRGMMPSMQNMSINSILLSATWEAKSMNL